MDLKKSGGTRTPFVAACIAAVVLQLALAPQISVFGGRINFMLVLTATAAVSGDSRALVFTGFFAGLLYDLTSPVPVGLMALLLSVSGYFFALGSRGIAPGLSMEALRNVGVMIVVVNVLNALALFFMGVETNLLVALGSRALMSSILDVLVACPFLMLASRGEQGRGFRASRGSATMRYKGLR